MGVYKFSEAGTFKLPRVGSKSMLVGNARFVPSLGPYVGGNQSSSDLQTFMSSMVQFDSQAPTAGGTLTLNSVSVGSYDYSIKRGAQTVSSFNNSDWFTTTSDTRSSLIAVNGDLVINAGEVFRPSNRKLFTCIYVEGNLTVNGELSMSGRGSNHSATTKGNIRIINGTYSGVLDPQIPADGGAGAVSVATTSSGGNVNGTTGTAGTGGGSGGGGAGGTRSNTNAANIRAGSGSAGTSFSGGAGGGGIWSNSTSALTADSGDANGGQGGDGATANNPDASAMGGAGNPDGASVGPLVGANADGTGGILIIFVTGTVFGSGEITANGVKGMQYVGSDLRGTSGGGGSGGGSVTLLCAADNSFITPTAAGGLGGLGTGECSSGHCPGGSGGAGGAGTARKLALV
jgi:hypothetical protein